MSSSIILPFNHQPTSCSLKTTAYSVPATSYARVTFIAGNCTNDGSDVFVQETFTTVVMAATTTFTYWLDTWDYITIARNAGTGTGTSRVQIPTHATAGAGGEVVISSGWTSESVFGHDLDDIIVLSTRATTPIYTGTHRLLQIESVGGVGTTTFDVSVYRAPAPITLWVEPGTSLDGSRYWVELYPVLS